MVAVLLLGLHYWNDWSAWGVWRRIAVLSSMIGAGGIAFVGTLFATGFRINDLRAV